MASARKDIGEEIQRITGGYVTLEAAQALRKRILNVCKIGGEGDPLSKSFEVRDTGKKWCRAVWAFLSKQDWLLPARDLMRELWELHAKHQRSSKNRRVFRALLAQLLTQTAYELGNKAEAFRWSLLTQADNILGKDREKGHYSRHWLSARFGMTDEERKALDYLAEECRNEAEANGWDSPSGFAEEVLRRFAKNDKYGRAVFQRLSGTEEFHLTRPYLGVLLDYMKHAPDNSSKGKRLEDVAFYLFSLLPGCAPRQNLYDLAGASEYDLVVSNMSPTSSLIGDVFGRDFLIECKNWSQAVGAEQVGYFLFRMSLTHCRFGIIIASRHITGTPEATGKLTGDAYAQALVRRAFHEHGSACVVISMRDLESLARGKVSGVTSLLMERLGDFRFGTDK
jgi:hypothetical protein